MGLFKRKVEKRDTAPAITLEQLLTDYYGDSVPITKEQALNIPAVSACVELISSTVASLPIKLYQEVDRKISEIKEDNRINLLNVDTGDTLDAFQLKKAMVADYLLLGAAYTYINRNRNDVKSLNFIQNEIVGINKSPNPIFKSYEILVFGQTFRDFEFLKITRKSIDGFTGTGIIKENSKALSVAYDSLLYENVLLNSGGNKKGFLKSSKKLDDPALEKLKSAWKTFYKNTDERVIILNDSLDFQESSNTSVELQLNENKKTNSAEICKILLTPPSILDGTSTEETNNNWIKICILPILTAIQTSLNKDLLLPSEKGSFYFAFDTKELLKGDILKRYKAYEIATKNGILQIDEIRYIEDYEPLGLKFIKLGLQDVLYNPETGEIYTPNTNKSTNVNNPTTTLDEEGGDNIAD